VAGIDPSATMIAAARRAAIASCLPIELQVASIYDLPFPDHAFDAVRAERVFQHLEDPEAGLREMVRVTRPGGRVMVMDPDHGQHGIALDDLDHHRVHEATRRVLLRMIVNPHSGSRLRGMFVRAGLGEVEQAVDARELPYPDYLRAMFLRERLASVVESGQVTRPEVDAFLAALEERHRAGTFFAGVIAYAVTGTRV
jgi:SAM-dependent methyltransferase